MNDELIRRVLDWLESHWHKKPVAVIAPVVISIVSLWLFYSSQSNNVSIVGWISSGAMGLIVLSIWILTNRLPRVAKGHVGIVVGMDEAVADYRHAFEGPIADGSVPIQSEEFIQIVLANEPNRIQLYFCLGLINYHAKADFAAAKRDLQEFLSKLKEGEFPRQAAIARELLAD